MSRTVNVNPLLVLLSLLVGTSIGDWVGGFFGSFVAALLSIPVAGALQVIARELWQATAWAGSPDSEPPAEPGPAEPGPAGPGEQAPETGRGLRDGEPELTSGGAAGPAWNDALMFASGAGSASSHAARIRRVPRGSAAGRAGAAGSVDHGEPAAGSVFGLNGAAHGLGQAAGYREAEPDTGTVAEDRRFLTVVAMKNWRRDEWFDETGLSWVNPSPNMRNLYEAVMYPGIGAIEGTNISVGRGTDTPFEQIGAPWIDGPRLSDELNGRHLPGVRFYPVRFTPASSKLSNQECQGVFIVVTDRDAVRPVKVGLEIAAALVKLFPGKFEVDAALRLFGSAANLNRIRANDDPAAVAASWSAAEAHWRLLRAKYLLY